MEHANIEKLSLRAPIKSWAKQSDVTVIPTEAPQWGAKWRPARPSRSGGDPSTRMTSLGMTADGQIAALPQRSLAMTRKQSKITTLIKFGVAGKLDPVKLLPVQYRTPFSSEREHNHGVGGVNCVSLNRDPSSPLDIM